ncbi:osmoprotectant transport system permease protein [Microterricola gilva]|uniref:Osmoprotectant transport system permease protein n=1 Tax=Microterricola gilva TaxID=393267 RepID=A0A4Q8ALP5_9MICO|nr:ABC transporter permease subunit [Microterricola gilva]RZU65464.1 osmoprotectant transport system permease protein [Microterricola gilva]
MSWFLANIGLVWHLTLVHIGISIIPIIAGLLLSLPLGLLAHRVRPSRGVLLAIGTILFTIPSLPLFTALPAVLGTGITSPVNVIVGLSIYALALMLRASADAFDAIDPDVRLSGRGMGFSRTQLFWQLELPLAGPVLLAGLRVVSATTVSLVSVGSAVGVTSLGYLFVNGFQRGIPAEVVTGIVATLLIAAVFDLALVGAGRVLMPWRGAAR